MSYRCVAFWSISSRWNHGGTVMIANFQPVLVFTGLCSTRSLRSRSHAGDSSAGSPGWQAGARNLCINLPVRPSKKLKERREPGGPL